MTKEHFERSEKPDKDLQEKAHKISIEYRNLEDDITRFAQEVRDEGNRNAEMEYVRAEASSEKGRWYREHLEKERALVESFSTELSKEKALADELAEHIRPILSRWNTVGLGKGDENLVNNLDKALESYRRSRTERSEDRKAREGK